MKKKTVFLFCLFLATVVGAQKIRYSKETIRSPMADVMYLVAGVEGYHHLLCFYADKRPRLFIFDPQMRVYARQELDVRVKSTAEIHVLSFSTHYFLYVHVPGTAQHNLLRVGPDGESEDVSAALRQPADSAWNRTTTSFQLFKEGGRLGLLTHAYYDNLKRIASTAVTFTGDMTGTTTEQAVFPFDRESERLQQVVYSAGSLLVLKSGRLEEKGHVLDVFRIHLASGRSYANSFASKSHEYIFPSLRFNPADSSVLVYSPLRENTGGGSVQRSGFASQLDGHLQERISPMSLRSPSRNSLFRFLLLNTDRPHWLSLFNNAQVPDGQLAFVNPQYGASAQTNRGFYNRRVNVFTDGYGGVQPPAVQLTLLNNRLKTTKDTLIANTGSDYGIQPRPYAQFVANNKAYLVLVENFTRNKQGLLLVTDNGGNGFATTGLAVYDRYQYLLPQLQGVAGGFVVPYTHKNEIGLLQITLTD